MHFTFWTSLDFNFPQIIVFDIIIIIIIITIIIIINYVCIVYFIYHPRNDLKPKRNH